MSEIIDYTKDLAIPVCVNCVGIHPDEPIRVLDALARANNPSKYIAKQLIKTASKLDMYKNKACTLCGRSYDKNGNLDETWELTAKKVKMSFDAVGIDGVSDSQIAQVVATCIKSWKMLWANRDSITPQDAEKMTFTGRLALIITHAQIARNKKNTIGGGKNLDKGLIV